ncbi:hypothetical protein HAX54_030822 [Datura stramonium]|uniref:Uncharacterized protein n=1 Tax=Datura stramonium TaxID=4076 RepID=A0ABS8VB37_DATST|nr:hypothetical protein [Datura stramonium]
MRTSRVQSNACVEFECPQKKSGGLLYIIKKLEDLRRIYFFVCREVLDVGIDGVGKGVGRDSGWFTGGRQRRREEGMSDWFDFVVAFPVKMNGERDGESREGLAETEDCGRSISKLVGKNGRKREGDREDLVAGETEGDLVVRGRRWYTVWRLFSGVVFGGVRERGDGGEEAGLHRRGEMVRGCGA